MSAWVKPELKSSTHCDSSWRQRDSRIRSDSSPLTRNECISHSISTDNNSQPLINLERFPCRTPSPEFASQWPFCMQHLISRSHAPLAERRWITSRPDWAAAIPAAAGRLTAQESLHPAGVFREPERSPVQLRQPARSSCDSRFWETAPQTCPRPGEMLRASYSRS